MSHTPLQPRCALTEHAKPNAVNRRAEVPVLVDRDVTVVDSADIVAYLDDRFPTPALLPAAPTLRLTARRWQRVADTALDAIIHDNSLWTWPTHHRADAPPAGLLEAGQEDLEIVLTEFDRALGSNDVLCGCSIPRGPGALPAHLVAEGAWNPDGLVLEYAPPERSMRALPCVRADLDDVKRSTIEKFAAARRRTRPSGSCGAAIGSSGSWRTVSGSGSGRSWRRARDRTEIGIASTVPRMSVRTATNSSAPRRTDSASNARAELR